ncbi:MAG: glycerol-3-phosphate dehydrogenase [Rhodospirillales bacterium]|jgi:glycerol-3-phosphate dehydrogenase|nr:glycerol-3-phosphate dehydrogenase [Rhodospirillales bacterium]MBT6111959.1 glycerol-3-phosphate dehydrogenase [Rhodospirillales bacterium]MBT7778190.1 glycerol-3-phosphate dehydrogenase [Rhodospirillales bacterium]
MATESDFVCDIFIIGGGINGCGVARDAAGRGLSVTLCEQGDLAQATSSASTKLFHGGLRYLEHYEFRLVREALIERERLLQMMPHISWPLRFVLPHHQGLRPSWFLRLGLFIYDHLGGRKLLPGTRAIKLDQDPVGKPLKDIFNLAFEYSDCWVDDARLVVLNAQDAAALGADIRVRTQFLSAVRQDGIWLVSLEDVRSGERYELRARCLVNASGPWVDEVISQKLHSKAPASIRLVRGSHVVVPKLFEHDKAYIFQNTDGRIIFAIPYQNDFTLIGTTDEEHQAGPDSTECSEDEKAYLCASISEYFEEPVQTSDVVWHYSGVRPLYDDGASSASQTTREYVLHVEDVDNDLPLLNIFGGKITTYRKLAEAALKKLHKYLPEMGKAWTAGAPLPGGNFNLSQFHGRVSGVRTSYPFIDERWATRLVRGYGTQVSEILGDAKSVDDLGQNFGSDLTEAELRWLIRKEWARTAEDVLWRRTKIGLVATEDDQKKLEKWMLTQNTEYEHAN